MPNKLEYFYGSVRVAPDVAKMFLSRGGVVASLDDEGAALFIVKQYADNRLDASTIVKNVRALSLEFEALARDLEEFIDAFEFTPIAGEDDGTATG